MKKIDIYTGVMCGYCDAAKHLLKKKKLEFNEINIATDPEKMDEMLKKYQDPQEVDKLLKL